MSVTQFDRRHGYVSHDKMFLILCSSLTRGINETGTFVIHCFLVEIIFFSINGYEFMIFFNGREKTRVRF